MLTGMANPIPCPWATLAVLIPTPSPAKLISGPPLLPGLMEAAVWMKLSYGPAPIRVPSHSRSQSHRVIEPEGLRWP
jgi:hypothetical protein